MTRIRLLLVIVCILAAGALAALIWRGMPGAANKAAAPSSGVASIGGPFALIDQNGRPTTEKILNGKWSAVYFGFTYCPDVCPTTLHALAQAQALLGPKAGDLQVVMISVDPERDKPALLKTYLESPAFPKSTIALTGTPAQVQGAIKAYRAYAQKEGEGDDYVVNHTSAVYLMDPKGRFNRVLAYNLAPAEIARLVAEAMGD